MQRILRYGAIALMLCGSTAIAIAQQEKTQQNSADEALVKSAPEAKQAPQAPPQTAPTPQASQPGIDAQQPALVDGKLAVPGAPTNAQTEPAKSSAQNAAKDKEPLVTGQAPN